MLGLQNKLFDFWTCFWLWDMLQDSHTCNELSKIYKYGQSWSYTSLCPGKATQAFCPTQFSVAKSVLESREEKQIDFAFWGSGLNRKEQFESSLTIIGPSQALFSFPGNCFQPTSFSMCLDNPYEMWIYCCYSVLLTVPLKVKSYGGVRSGSRILAIDLREWSQRISNIFSLSRPSVRSM